MKIKGAILVAAFWLSICQSAFGFAGGGCFLKGTPVLLADGSELPIEQIKPGDRIQAFNNHGKLVSSTVRKVFRIEQEKYLLIRTANRSVSVTYEHPFYVGDGKFKKAGDFQIGDYIHVLNLSELDQESVIEIRTLLEKVPVYNIFTDNPNTYFASGIAVHNKGGGGGYSGGGGSYSGGGGGGDLPLPCAIPLVIFYLYMFFSKNKSSNGNLDVVISRSQIAKKKNKTLKLLNFIGKTDENWKPQKLEEHTRDVYLKLQKQWQARDYNPVKEIIGARIYRDHTRQLNGLKRNNEINVIDDLVIKDIDLVNVRYTHRAEDREYTALITVSAINYYIDDRTRKFIRGDKTPLDHQEFWTFEWSGNKWVLREIEQSSSSDILADENFFEQFTDTGLNQIYAETAEDEASAGPWLEKEVEVKDNKIERLLNFLVQTDKIWDRTEMQGFAREVFLQVMLDREKGELTDETRNNLMPDISQHISSQASNIEIEYRNLSVRKVELVLVRNFHAKVEDEYTARIRAHAQIIIKRNGQIIKKQSDVMTWDEYLVFGRVKDQWKLKEILADDQGSAIWDQENYDEDTTQHMLEWYYSKNRAA